MASSPPDYRYLLTRWWSDEGFDLSQCLLWIMLNPSTATQSRNDKTINICSEVTEQHGYKGLAVVNLFAKRCSDSKKLKNDLKGDDGNKQFDLWTGPGNDAVVRACCEVAPEIVLAWGDDGAGFCDELRGEALAAFSDKLRCLKFPNYETPLTNKRQPRHPNPRIGSKQKRTLVQYREAG